MTINNKCNLINRLISEGVITFSNDYDISVKVADGIFVYFNFIIHTSEYITFMDWETLYEEVDIIVNIFGEPELYSVIRDKTYAQ